MDRPSVGGWNVLVAPGRRAQEVAHLIVSPTEAGGTERGLRPSQTWGRDDTALLWQRSGGAMKWRVLVEVTGEDGVVTQHMISEGERTEAGQAETLGLNRARFVGGHLC